MKKTFYFSFGLPIILTIFVSCFFIPFLQNSASEIKLSSSSSPFYSSLISNAYTPNFLWPTPGYTKITSKFGYRNSPITGKKSYHGGIDIGAPENSSILAIANGTVFYVGWYGANGYTVILQHDNQYKSIYGHVSPNFLVSIGDSIKKGELIAKVGPKYVEKKSYTTYQDASGKYTNGSTTRSPLAFYHHKRKSKDRPTFLFLNNYFLIKYLIRQIILVLLQFSL